MRNLKELRDTYLPHIERRLALVTPEARGAHQPIVARQLFGGKRWSLAIVTFGEIRKDEN